MKLTAFSVLMLLVSAGAAGAAPPQPSAPVSIEGQVFDANGSPVPRCPVRLLMTRRLVTLRDMSTRDEVAEGPSATTDEGGFFRLELHPDPDPDYDFFYLRFYDKTGFDTVRYAIPEDEDITAALRAGRSVIVQRRLEDAPQWPAVQSELQRVGGAHSSRGRLLRSLGLPDEVVGRSDGLTEWRYEKAGVRYLIENGEVVERASLSPAGSPAP